MSCVHSPFTCDDCLLGDDDGIEHGAKETIPETTAATAAVFMDAMARQNAEQRQLIEENALLRRENEELRLKLKAKRRRSR